MKPRTIFDDMGFTRTAESLNGRLARVAFFTALLVELLTGEGFLAFLQLR